MKLTDLSLAGASWLKEQGALDSSVLSKLRPSDIEPLSLADKVILRARFPNLDPGAQGIAQAGRKSAGLAAVNRLATSDQKTADDLEAALQAGIEFVVVDLDGNALVDPTIQLFDHLRDGGSAGPLDLWAGNRFVDVTAFCRGDKVRVSPTSGRELQAGVEPVTGLAWGKLSVDMAALASWASSSGMLSSITETEALEAFAYGGPLVSRCEDYAKANKVDLEPYRLFVTGISTPAQDSEGTGWTVDVDNPRKALGDLVLSMFGEHDVRQLAKALGVAGNIPGSTASPAALGFGLVDALARHGLIDTKLFDMLLRERPRRAYEINAVRRSCGV